MNKAAAILLIATMLFTAIPVSAEVIVDGEYLYWMNESCINENGRIFVPVNEAAEAFGAEAKSVDENTVDLYYEDKFLCRLIVGVPFAYTKGAVLNFGASPKLENDVMYVPLRAFAEALGAKVEWIEASETVLIDKSDRDIAEIVNPKKDITEREVSLLDGRYMVKMPLATETLDNWYTEQKYETMLRYEYGENTINVKAYDLFALSCGDLKQDLENVSDGEAVAKGDVVEQNGCKYLLFGQKGHKAIATGADGELIIIIAEGDGDRLDDVCKRMFESLKATDKCFEMGGEVKAGWYIFTLPENYIAFYEIGPDFDLWYIYEIVTSGKVGVSALIYGGYYPSYSGEKTTKSIEGEFLGKKVTWNIAVDGDMDALLREPDSDWCYHLSANNANSAAKRSEIIKIFTSIKRAE